MTCRKIDTNQVARKKEAIGYYRIESAIALFCALLINIFVVSVFARGFYGKVSTDDHLLTRMTQHPLQYHLLSIAKLPCRGHYSSVLCPNAAPEMISM